ncbi:MAG: hypothetical protein BWY53_00687 [Parcubacteria group bacterium ADurb.Bin326]|nr:MAG: hypothetical protein BWY53_00687 [Parcubacteria group bacterium ADurb.Bin326]
MQPFKSQVPSFHSAEEQSIPGTGFFLAMKGHVNTAKVEVDVPK